MKFGWVWKTAAATVSQSIRNGAFAMNASRWGRERHAAQSHTDAAYVPCGMGNGKPFICREAVKTAATIGGCAGGLPSCDARDWLFQGDCAASIDREQAAIHLLERRWALVFGSAAAAGLPLFG